MHFTFICHFILLLVIFIHYALECILGTNVNINENIALHTYLSHFMHFIFYYALECILGTNVNINENLALHAYLFILLYVKTENTKIM